MATIRDTEVVTYDDLRERLAYLQVEIDTILEYDDVDTMVHLNLSEAASSLNTAIARIDYLTTRGGLDA